MHGILFGEVALTTFNRQASAKVKVIQMTGIIDIYA